MKNPSCLQGIRPSPIKHFYKSKITVHNYPARASFESLLVVKLVQTVSQVYKVGA